MLYSAGYSGHSRQQIVPTSLRLPVNSGHSQSGDTGSSNDFIPGIQGSVPWPRAYLQSWLRVFETKPRLCGGSWTRLTSNNNPFTSNGILPKQPMVMRSMESQPMREGQGLGSFFSFLWLAPHWLQLAPSKYLSNIQPLISGNKYFFFSYSPNCFCDADASWE